MALGPNSVFDEFRSFPDGMNAGVDPAELPRTQLAMLRNGTVRGSFVSGRPPFHALSITGDFDGAGMFQGACYYKPDFGTEQIIAQIGGKIFAYSPGFDSVASANISISGDLNPADPTSGPFQAWLWQAERWIIGNDGQTAPWFYDGVKVTRSGLSNQIATVAAIGSVAVGNSYDVAIAAYPSGGIYSGPFNVPVNISDPVSGVSYGQFEIQQVTGGAGTQNTLQAAAGNSQTTLPSGAQLQIRTPVSTWNSSITSNVSAASSSVTDNFAGTVAANMSLGAGGSVNIPISSSYTGPALKAGDLITIGAHPNIVVNSFSATGWPYGGNVNVQLSVGFSVTAGTAVTGPSVTTTIPAPTQITIPLASAFPGVSGQSLYITSGAHSGSAFTVISVSGLSVTVSTSGWTGTLASGTTVTNTITPGYTTTVVGTLTAAASGLSTATPVDVAFTPIYTGGQLTVYDSVYNQQWLIGSYNVPATTTIKLYVVRLNTGVSAIAANAKVYLSNQLPIARMGAYVMGRSWMSLPDGVTFICSDATGESSGSVQYKYRDAVLFANDVNQLTAGTFSVPGGTSGQIAFIAPMNTLDASLGQGPVQIGTPTGVFSCNLPVDSSQWQSMTGPLLTQSVIGGGAAGQWSAVNVNSDLFYRGSDGSIRSLKLSRQEFATWGQVPCSKEVQSILAADDPQLLQWCSGCYFDNRLLMTTGLTRCASGVYGSKMVAINFDRVSSLAGKAPSVYDGVWDGLNVLQLVSGSFQGKVRCFAFIYDTATALIRITEIATTAPKPQSEIISSTSINDRTLVAVQSSALLTPLKYPHPGKPAVGSDILIPDQYVAAYASAGDKLIPNGTTSYLVFESLSPLPESFTSGVTVLVTDTGSVARLFNIQSVPLRNFATPYNGSTLYISGLQLTNASGVDVTVNVGSLLSLSDVTWSSANTVAEHLVEWDLVRLESAWVGGVGIVLIDGLAHLLTSPTNETTNSESAITFRAETCRIMAEAPPAGAGRGKRRDQLAMLSAGELYLKDLQADVALAVYFRPDYSWNWTLWRSWTISYAPNNASFCRVVGLGEPPKTSDPTTKRPWREGYHFQLAIEVTGHCTIMGGRIYAEVMPTPAFAPMNPVT